MLVKDCASRRKKSAAALLALIPLYKILRETSLDDTYGATGWTFGGDMVIDNPILTRFNQERVPLLIVGSIGFLEESLGSSEVLGIHFVPRGLSTRPGN